MPKKKELAPHLRVRLDARLLERLEKSREKSGRTLTGEISHRLEETFRKEDAQKQTEYVATEAAIQAVREFVKEGGMYGGYSSFDEMMLARFGLTPKGEDKS